MELTQKAKNYLAKDLNISRFCLRAKISRATFLRRKKEPEKFKASEIKALSELIGVNEVFKK